MKRLIIYLLLLLSVVDPLKGDDAFSNAKPRILSFYEVVLVEAAGGNEGRLDASVWDEIPVSDRFFVYWKTEMQAGELQSGLQMAYDADGLYLRIFNKEENPAGMMAERITRGDPHLWKDDCVQIYFDPAATGIGYMAFTINSLGVQHDRKQLDGAVSLEDWRGENWRTWVSKGNKGWIIEAYFPFSDLGKRAKAGDVWMFNLVRYGYSSGDFLGTSWALGGTYASPGFFGYLSFGSGEKASTGEIAKVLERSASPPWSLVDGDRMIRYIEHPEVVALSQVEAALRKQSNKLRGLISEMSPEQNALPPETSEAMPAGLQKLQALQEEVEGLIRVYRSTKTARLMNEINP